MQYTRLRRALFTSILLVVISSLLVVAAQAQPSTVGQWSGPVVWPDPANGNIVDPTHLSVLPDGRVMAWTREFGTNGLDLPYNSNTYVWNPVSNTTIKLNSDGSMNYDPTNPNLNAANLFCSGHGLLADGSLVVTGGKMSSATQCCTGPANTTLFDFNSNTWFNNGNKFPPYSSGDWRMTNGRWYPTDLALFNGELLVVGGLDLSQNNNTIPEVWKTSGGWRELSTADSSQGAGIDWYPWLHLTPSGQVFHSGPGTTSHFLETSGTGSWSSGATHALSIDRHYGSAVMYDYGKVMVVGGSNPATNTAETIDLTAAPPVWKQTGSMSFARQHFYATVLPDGKVLVTGGTRGKNTFARDDTDVAPANQQWQLTSVGSGYYRISSRNSPSNGDSGSCFDGAGNPETGLKVLDVQGGPSATQDGAPVQVYTDLGGTNQQWQLVSTNDGYYNIIARHSGKCLDVTGGVGATGNGVHLQQYSCLGTDNQKFQLLLNDGTSGTINQSVFYSIMAKNSQKVLDVTATFNPDGSIAPACNATLVQQWDYFYNPVLAAELWDPTTGAWSTMASMQVERLYHSSAVLLPDGRVMVAGGGADPTAPGDMRHKNVEFFSPPYLFNGARPGITSAPSTINYGQTFFVATPNAASIARISLVRLSSSTHSYNENQRISFLGFSQASGGLNVVAPINGAVCPPGHYLLFLLNSSGVPSLGKIVQVILPPSPPLNLDLTRVYSIAAQNSGKVLDVIGGPGAVSNGTLVQQWDYLGGTNQQWQIVALADGYYNIRANNSGKCLDVIGGPAATADGINLQQYDCLTNQSNQEWAFYPVGNGLYKIIAKHSGRGLDVTGGPGATQNGILIQQYDYLGGSNQQWKLTPQ